MARRWRCVTPREIVYQLLTGGRIERTVATRPPVGPKRPKLVRDRNAAGSGLTSLATGPRTAAEHKQGRASCIGAGCWLADGSHFAHVDRRMTCREYMRTPIAAAMNRVAQSPTIYGFTSPTNGLKSAAFGLL